MTFCDIGQKRKQVIGVATILPAPWRQYAFALRIGSEAGNAAGGVETGGVCEIPACSDDLGNARQVAARPHRHQAIGRANLVGRPA